MTAALCYRIREEGVISAEEAEKFISEMER